jgi:hypothetical protein
MHCRKLQHSQCGACVFENGNVAAGPGGSVRFRSAQYRNTTIKLSRRKDNAYNTW